MRQRAAPAALIGSILLFWAALPLPAFCQETCSGGFGVLIWGWLGVFAGPDTPANFAWLANPALIGTWLLTRARAAWPAMGAALVALTLGLIPLVARTVTTNEGGIAFPITGFAIGYWLWMASMVAALLAAASVTRENAQP